MMQKKLRLSSIFTDLMQNFGIYLVAFALQFFFISRMRRDLDHFKSSVYTLDMGKLLPTTLGLIVSTITRLNSLFVFFVLQL